MVQFEKAEFLLRRKFESRLFEKYGAVLRQQCVLKSVFIN
jgi:hypothetical protein